MRLRGSVGYRFQARDLNLVLAPRPREANVRFSVRIDDQAPGDAHGLDIDAAGEGAVSEPRMYQLVRRRNGSRRAGLRDHVPRPGRARVRLHLRLIRMRQALETSSGPDAAHGQTREQNDERDPQAIVSRQHKTRGGCYDTNAPQAQGLKRTDIQEHDLSVPGRVVVQNRVDVSPDASDLSAQAPGGGAYLCSGRIAGVRR